MKFIIFIYSMFFANHLFASTHQVWVYENRFDPEVLVIESGDTVQWKVISGNHQIIATENQQGVEFDSPYLTANDQFSTVVTGTGGEIYYQNSITANMQGALNVKTAANDFIIDVRVNAGYHNADMIGQGLLFEFVPNTQLLIAYWFTYTASGDAQQWLIATGTAQGDRANLTVLKPTDGQLNGSQTVTNEPWGELTVVFESCYKAMIYYNDSTAQLSGQFAVERTYLGQPCEAGETP